MAYCTQADILRQLPEEKLIELTDDNGLAVDSDVVDRAIADAQAEIDSYLAVQYALPLASVPDRIRSVAVTLAICYLYRRRVDELPESRRSACDRERKWLEAVGAGRAALGSVPEPTADEDAGPRTTSDPDDRIFTIGKGTTSGTLDNF